MTNQKKDIFNWNHISDKLTEEEVAELKALYKFYHKKYWLFKMTEIFQKSRTCV